jgi:hypothetical protein
MISDPQGHMHDMNPWWQPVRLQHNTPSLAQITWECHVIRRWQTDSRRRDVYYRDADKDSLYVQEMSFGMPYDMISNRRWASRHLAWQRQLQIKPTGPPRRHTKRYKLTGSVETKVLIQSIRDLSKDSRKGAGKTTPSVSTPAAAKRTQDSIYKYTWAYGSYKTRHWQAASQAKRKKL